MFKTKIITADSIQKLESEINTFFQELTNVELIHVQYQNYESAGTKVFSCLVVYRIDNAGTRFGSA